MALGVSRDLRVLHPCPRQEAANPVSRELLLLQKGPPGLSEPPQGRQPSDMLRVQLNWHCPGEKQGSLELTCGGGGGGEVASAFGAKCL